METYDPTLGVHMELSITSSFGIRKHGAAIKFTGALQNLLNRHSITSSVGKMGFPKMTSQSWDDHAKEYAAMPFENSMAGPAKALLASLNSLAPFSSATAILDVGSGSGLVIHLLNSTYGSKIPSSVRIIASDYSTVMVECIRERRELNSRTDKDGAGIWTRMEALVLDATDLTGVSDGTISHVTGNMVYFILPEPKLGLKEAHRVLAPNGAIAFTSPQQLEWIELLNQAILNVRPAAAKRFDPRQHERWASAEGLKAELEELGFKDVKTEYAFMTMDTSNPSLFANFFIKGSNPGARMLMGDLSEADVEMVCVEWARLARERGPVLKGTIVIAIGSKGEV